MIKATDFNRMWIDVPEALRTLLADGAVLTCSHEQVQFVMAADLDGDGHGPAFETAARLRAAGHRPAFVLLLSQSQLDALAAGHTIETAVWVEGYESVGEIRLAGRECGLLNTDLAMDRVSTSTVLGKLQAGDFFAISERDEDRNWVLYRAVADADGGVVDAQRVMAPTAPLAQFTGANQVVFLLPKRAELLKRLGWTDLTANVA